MKNNIGVKIHHIGDIALVYVKDIIFKLHEKILVDINGNQYVGVVVFINNSNCNMFSCHAKFIRHINNEDKNNILKIQKKEKVGKCICNKLVEKNKLAMKIIDCEYSFDNKKVMFYFSSQNRVDFRQLIKDLSFKLKVKIELIQIGARDAARIMGGIGYCGRKICCTTYLKKFMPTSIKIAKDQNLPINISKLSGICDRLMCCLNNEKEIYSMLKKNMPLVGDEVKTCDGYNGIVYSTDILKQTARIIVNFFDNEKDIKQYHISDLKITKHKK